MLGIVMLSVIMLSVITLRVITLSVIMLSVVAPSRDPIQSCLFFLTLKKPCFFE